MNNDLLIKITHRISVYGAIALTYWVFIFLIVTVFDLKIFRERMTETFFLSVLGILSVLGGALVLNLVSNLSKISAALSQNSNLESSPTPKTRRFLALFLLSFPLIMVGLFAGHEISAQRKKSLMIGSAEKLISENQAFLALLADYQFSPEYIKVAETTLNVISKIDKHLPETLVIVPDVIEGKKVFLGFGGRQYGYDQKDKLEKARYIYPTSWKERDYLERVFSSNETGYQFYTEKGNYQLYFPTKIEGKKLVLYFSDFQRYGKFGS